MGPTNILEMLGFEPMKHSQTNMLVAPMAFAPQWALIFED
jgi:hypothetical protein